MERPPFSCLVVICILGVKTASGQEAWSAQIFGCAKSCEARRCDNQGIRYGKYCGIFHTGCDGEDPCDALDACCRGHDLCLSSWRILLSSGRESCHTELVQCMDELDRNGAKGFSEECPLSQAMQTIRSRNMYRRRDASLELDMTDLAAGAGTQASRFGPEGTKECQELFWEGARFGIELAQQAKAPR